MAAYWVDTRQEVTSCNGVARESWNKMVSELVYY